MTKHIFYIVDVFAEVKYTGNQLAVITNAEDLSELEMQKLANEMHFSETAFVLAHNQSNNEYAIRIFTPSVEVPFAGHPALGTAYIINNFIAKCTSEEVILNVKAGQIKINFEHCANGKETVWMRQLPPVFDKTIERSKIQNLLGLGQIDIDDRYPIEEISTGLPFLIVPLQNLEAVKKARINKNILLEITKQKQVGILVFSPQTYNRENQLNVRVFVDAFGIPEDPATGSANGCLAAYLVKHQYFGNQIININVEQGFEINRPSILHLRAKTENNEIQIDVGGRVLLTARGEIF